MGNYPSLLGDTEQFRRSIALVKLKDPPEAAQLLNSLLAYARSPPEI
jgi:hypothetical protein